MKANCKQILADPATSLWLKQAVVDSCHRDIVDAIVDATALVGALKLRYAELIRMQQPELNLRWSLAGPLLSSVSDQPAFAATASSSFVFPRDDPVGPGTRLSGSAYSKGDKGENRFVEVGVKDRSK